MNAVAEMQTSLFCIFDDLMVSTGSPYHFWPGLVTFASEYNKSITSIAQMCSITTNSTINNPVDETRFSGHPASLNKPSRPHFPRQMGHSPCPTASPVHRKIQVQQNKCPHSAAVGSFIASKQSGQRRLPAGIYANTAGSARSITAGVVSVLATATLGKASGVAFWTALSVPAGGFEGETARI